MWINISCFILAAIILLFIETRYTLYKVNKLGKDILLSVPPNHSDDSLNISFNHYFLANTGIFVGTEYCFEKITIFSALHSISMFICIVFALLNAFYSLWSLSAAFVVLAILLLFICNLSTEFPLRNDAHKTFLRTILNFKNKYPNDDMCKELDIAQTKIINPMAERLFFLRSSEITRNYFKHQKSTQITNSATIEKISQPSNSTSSTQPPSHNADEEPPESLDKNTVRYVLWKKFFPIRTLLYEDIPFLAFYFRLIKNREQVVSYNGFEMLFFHLVLSDIKVFGKSDLDSFNKSNANFDFDKYDEEFDTKCYEDDDNIYDSDLMDRGCIRFILLPYFELRKKLLTMKVDDIEKTIEENKETITQIEKQASDEASAISAEHKKLIQKAPEGTIIDMNWNSVYELERKRIALETENKFLLFFHNKVHS